MEVGAFVDFVFVYRLFLIIFTLDEGLCPLPTVAEVTVADGVRQGGHQDECLTPSIRKLHLKKNNNKKKQQKKNRNKHVVDY
jgi:hypothetical protein